MVASVALVGYFPEAVITDLCYLISWVARSAKHSGDGARVPSYLQLWAWTTRSQSSDHFSCVTKTHYKQICHKLSIASLQQCYQDTFPNSKYVSVTVVDMYKQLSSLGLRVKLPNKEAVYLNLSKSKRTKR